MSAVRADPGNAKWQLDVVMSLKAVATVEVQQGEHQQALGGFESGREIIVSPQAASPRNV